MFDFFSIPSFLRSASQDNIPIGETLSFEEQIGLFRSLKYYDGIFRPELLADKLLLLVARGEQDAADALLRRHPNLLLETRKVTDYSGRTFNCTAYEYAYWAKDTHMCRMLERHMDEEIKAAVLDRINEMERIDEETNQPIGLSYIQNGVEHRSAHFDLTPFTDALVRYIKHFRRLMKALKRDEMIENWMRVGRAQRDFPAHFAQEYCRPDRGFSILPSFNVDDEDIPKEELPRTLWFSFWFEVEVFWYPPENPGFWDIHQLGTNLAVCKYGYLALGTNYGGVDGELYCSIDLKAITHLDAVRTKDLEQSRNNLTPLRSAPELSI